VLKEVTWFEFIERHPVLFLLTVLVSVLGVLRIFWITSLFDYLGKQALDAEKMPSMTEDKLIEKQVENQDKNSY
jgi:dolichyl-phosphate-mannose--protein O-mannosyl transferase